MKKYLILGAAVIVVAFSIIWADRKIDRLLAERDRYRGNTETLLADIETYRVRDSLNAARVEALEFTKREYERFRAEDAALIKQLKGRNRDLVSANKTQAQTIIDLMAVPRDTTIIRDTISLPAVTVSCGDAWYDFQGVLTKGTFTGKLRNRDSLIVAETVQYKRFLGFLWRTNKVKSRSVDVCSKNPHTTIVGVEYVIINK